MFTAVRIATCACLLLAGLFQPPVRAAAPTEQQVKAVFLFNFSNFVDWPAGTFATTGQPFVIGLLGGADLVPLLEQAVQGEQVDGRSLQVRRFDTVEQIGDCQILFIARAHGERLGRVLQQLRGEPTLTVSDLDGASRRGVMIQLVNERNRIRLAINVEEARAAGLSISSNLLRPAEIVRTQPEAAP